MISSSMIATGPWTHADGARGTSQQSPRIPCGRGATWWAPRDRRHRRATTRCRPYRIGTRHRRYPPPPSAVEIAAQHRVEPAGAPAAVAAAHERRWLAAIAADDRARARRLVERCGQRRAAAAWPAAAPRAELTARRTRASRGSTPVAVRNVKHMQPASRARARGALRSPLTSSSGSSSLPLPAFLDICMCRFSAQPRYMPSSCRHQARGRAAVAAPASSAGSTMSATSMGAASNTSLMPSLTSCSCRASRRPARGNNGPAARPAREPLAQRLHRAGRGRDAVHQREPRERFEALRPLPEIGRATSRPRSRCLRPSHSGDGQRALDAARLRRRARRIPQRFRSAPGSWTERRRRVPLSPRRPLQTGARRRRDRRTRPGSPRRRCGRTRTARLPGTAARRWWRRAARSHIARSRA